MVHIANLNITIDASIQKFLFNKKIYSEELLAGTDEWQAGGGGGSTGASNFTQCMENKDTFKKIDKNSPILPFLQKAQKDISNTIKEYQLEREAKNQEILKKRQQMIDKYLKRDPR